MWHKQIKGLYSVSFPGLYDNVTVTRTQVSSLLVPEAHMASNLRIIQNCSMATAAPAIISVFQEAEKGKGKRDHSKLHLVFFLTKVL